MAVRMYFRVLVPVVDGVTTDLIVLDSDHDLSPCMSPGDTLTLV